MNTLYALAEHILHSDGYLSEMVFLNYVYQSGLYFFGCTQV